MASVANSLHKSVMRLRIKAVQRPDLGSYDCVAKNLLGETRGTTRVHERSGNKGTADASSRLWKYTEGASSRK